HGRNPRPCAYCRPTTSPERGTTMHFNSKGSLTQGPPSDQPEQHAARQLRHARQLQSVHRKLRDAHFAILSQHRVLTMRVLFGLIGLCLLIRPAEAQLARTFISSLGNDANDCQRLTPCRTFQGAHDKTLANGEITLLDPGGYGAVTITKAISIIN